MFLETIAITFLNLDSVPAGQVGRVRKDCRLTIQVLYPHHPQEIPTISDVVVCQGEPRLPSTKPDRLFEAP